MADTWQTVEQAAVTLRMSVRTVNRHISAGKLASRLADGRREVLVSLPDPAPSPEPDELKEAVRSAFQRLNALAAESLADEPAGEFEEPASMAAPVSVADDVASKQAPEPGPTSARQPAFESAPKPAFQAEAQPAPASAPTYAPPEYLSQPSVTRATAGGIDTQMILALADSAADKAELAVSAYQTLARAAETRMETTRRSARFAWAAVALMAAGVTGAVGWTSHHLTRARTEAESLRQQVTVTSATADTTARERDELRAELASAREAAARAEGHLEAATQAQVRMDAEAKENLEQETRVEKNEAPRSLFERWAALWAGEE